MILKTELGERVVGPDFGAGPTSVPDELSLAAESALVHRLLEDGDNPNDWTVLAVWASDGAYAVALEGEGVRAFTVVPEGHGYAVIETTQR